MRKFLRPTDLSSAAVPVVMTTEEPMDRRMDLIAVELSRMDVESAEEIRRRRASPRSPPLLPSFP
jgi:hypothetical protein